MFIRGLGFIELYKKGKIRAIGVSNFLPHHLKALVESEIKPMVNQIEFHPGFMQEETVEYCKKNGIDIYTDFEVCAIDKREEGFILHSVNGGKVEAKTVINCAGFASDKIAALIGDSSFKMGARRGEYILLAKIYKR